MLFDGEFWRTSEMLNMLQLRHYRATDFAAIEIGNPVSSRSLVSRFFEHATAAWSARIHDDRK